MQSKETIGVIGPGRMGAGIAHVFAWAGHSVRLVDLKDRPPDKTGEALLLAVKRIRTDLEFLSSCGLLDPNIVEEILSKVRCVDRTDAADELAGVDLIFEAVPEILAVKQEVLGEVSAWAGRETPIASATSTFRVDVLAEYITRPERFLNTHWLNPAYLMPLVEVSPSPETSPNVLRHVMKLLESVGKTPVKCAPSAGFIVPRIQALAMNEAARLAEEGAASVEDIDKAVKVGFGLRFAVLGLLEFIDWGGGDTLYYASRYLREALGTERFEPPEIVVQNMTNGTTGVNAGRGFYDYSTINLPQYQEETIRRFVDLLRYMDLLPPLGL